MYTQAGNVKNLPATTLSKKKKMRKTSLKELNETQENTERTAVVNPNLQPSIYCQTG